MVKKIKTQFPVVTIIFIVVFFLSCGEAALTQNVDFLESVNCLEIEDCDGDGVPSLCDLDDQDEMNQEEVLDCDACLAASEEELALMNCGPRDGLSPNIGINADVDQTSQTPTGSVVGDGEVSILPVL